MEEIYYVEMKDYKNDIDWSPVCAFTNKEDAERYAYHRNRAYDGRLYVVQSLRVIL